jgi:hypothetical protein
LHADITTVLPADIKALYPHFATYSTTFKATLQTTFQTPNKSTVEAS